jgi:cytochrome c-type biogenesis protein CcsB
MYLSSIAATATAGNIAALSQDFLTAGMVLVVAMTMIYLWYIVGVARLSNRLDTEQAANRQSRKTQESSQAVVAGGGVATLVHSEVIEYEQPDGELPIALNRNLVMIGRVASILGWLAVATMASGLVFRSIAEQHAPWSDLYEFSISFTTALLLCYLIFEARFHEQVRTWGLYIGVLSITTLGLALYLGIAYGMINETQSLIPALQDKTILTVHVFTAILAYALFSVAFGAGLIMLIQGGEGQRYRWLPSAEAADTLGYKAVIAGFPLLALTLILGAYWAYYAWGHYWSWDPKETSALVTWLIYAVYLHARGIRGWRGKRIAWLLTLGFVATLFTYYGVSFFVPSLHSYALPG